LQLERCFRVRRDDAVWHRRRPSLLRAAPAIAAEVARNRQKVGFRRFDPHRLASRPRAQERLRREVRRRVVAAGQEPGDLARGGRAAGRLTTGWTGSDG